MQPSYVELGIGIGKYEIRQQGKQAWVHHAPNVALAFISDDAKMRIESAKAMKPLRLKAFLVRVRDYVSGRVKPAMSLKRLKQPINNSPDASNKAPLKKATVPKQ